MSGRKGVYRKVTAVGMLGDPGSKSRKVLALECGHFRTEYASSHHGPHNGNRMWCGICTKEELRKRTHRVTLTQQELDDLVEKEVTRRLREKRS